MNNLKIIGISVEKTNQNGKAIEDLGKLWGRFFSENVIEKIPNKINEEVYAVYTDYENDYRGKYTTIIGMAVSSLDKIPAGLVGRAFEAQNFKKFIAKGEMPNAVGKTWKEIWDKDAELNRSYIYDYEVYGSRSQNGANAEVDIYIGIIN